MEQEYKCIEDYQGTGWCVGEIDTAYGWRDRALSWLESDGTDKEDPQGFYKHLERMEDEKTIMEEISDYWQIGFETYGKPDYKQMYDDYSKEWAFSARMYFTLLKLALGHPEYSSYETAKAVRHTDEPYKKVLRALNEIDENGEPTRKSVERH